MDQILYQYTLNPTTWVYLSSILIIAIYFKFSRFWSVRNLDLAGLIALAPGLLLVAQGKGLGQAGVGQDPEVVQFGYVWLFAVGLFFLVRLLGDPMMIRRPLLEPNLTAGGLTFIGVSLLIFLMANVITAELTETDLEGARRLDQLLSRREAPPDDQSLTKYGPGYPLLHLLPSIPSKLFTNHDAMLSREEARKFRWVATARTMAIVSHLAVVVGLILIGYRHFNNIRTGVAVATLYLLLPYTAHMTGRVDHVVPAALLVWAIEAYRRPLVAGMLLGLAVGVIYYPIFLLPLWIAFYWQRGLLRFIGGVVSMVGLLVLTLVFTSGSIDAFWTQVQSMFGWPHLSLVHVDGFWDAGKAAYRITVLAAFVALSGSLALWPAQKNLGTLISCSTAIMLGTQFWHAQGGGLYMAWYLPLLLLTIFRPNLEDRIALATLGEGWLERRRGQLRGIVRAA